nr:MAG TPA: hypothetical protein [Caudoviricetes sp.]
MVSQWAVKWNYMCKHIQPYIKILRDGQEDKSLGS